MAVARREPRDGRSVRQAQRPQQPAVDDLFHPGDRAVGEEAQETGGVERFPIRQSQRDGAGRRVAAGSLHVPARPPTQLSRRARVHLAHGVVELAQAGEAGREGDVGERQVGGLDQQPRSLRALRARQRERPRAELDLEQAAQLTRTIRQALRQSVDAVTVDDAVGDETHRAPGRVGP